MTKFYSLVAAVVLAVGVNAQTTEKTLLNETFASMNGTGGSDGGWSGSVASNALKADDVPGWDLVTAYKASKSIKLGTGSKGGSATTPALTGLVSGNNKATLSFEAGAWNGNNESTTLSVGVSDGATVDLATVTLIKGKFTVYTIEISDLKENAKITLGTSTGNARFFLKNVVVVQEEKEPPLSTIDFNKAKLALVKNTTVGNSLEFAVKSDVTIYNTNGQAVRTFSTKENSSVDVSSLPKGVYIVTGVVGGKSVSQKIIKK